MKNKFTKIAFGFFVLQVVSLLLQSLIPTAETYSIHISFLFGIVAISCSIRALWDFSKNRTIGGFIPSVSILILSVLPIGLFIIFFGVLLFAFSH